jgi:hypothetical protein
VLTSRAKKIMLTFVIIAPVEPESGVEPVPQTPTSPKKKDVEKGKFCTVNLETKFGVANRCDRFGLW